MSASCIFCSLIRKPNASLIQEDEHLCIYPDIAPQAPHHFLIIPKKHYNTINECTEEDQWLLGHMMYVAQQLAAEKKCAESGYRLIINCNAEGGQCIAHIHLHFLGGRVMHWPPG